MFVHVYAQGLFSLLQWNRNPSSLLLAISLYQLCLSFGILERSLPAKCWNSQEMSKLVNFWSFYQMWALIYPCLDTITLDRNFILTLVIPKHRNTKTLILAQLSLLGKACLPNNAYHPRTPDYTLYSGVHVCWSEHSDSSFVYGFMSLDYGLGRDI